MFRKLIKNKKAQNTAEYAILISLVVAGIIAMQTYAQRALQARVRDASSLMTSVTGNVAGFSMGTSAQYEPYYLNSNYDVYRDDTDKERLGNNLVRKEKVSNRSRSGGETSIFNSSFGNMGI